jgi:hypothetical protein
VDPKLSIIISNRNDLVMLSITIRSCIEALKQISPLQSDIIIVDNSDDVVKGYLNSVLPTGYFKDGKLKLYHQPFPCLFSARELAASKSTADYILCLDSHMLVGHSVISDLVSFMDAHQDDPTLAFAHAPISWAHQHESRSKHDRDMSQHELGPWGTQYDHVKTITWKGMPWICRRKWFLDRDKGLGGYGALADHKISWGGGDMHIGIKPWLLGFKNWAVPTNPCIHIGPFPKIDLGNEPGTTKVSKPTAMERYRLYSSSGNYPHTFGFLVSCYVLGGEPMMKRNEKMINEKFGRYINTTKWWDKAIELGHDEREWLLSKQQISFEELLIKRPWDA